MLANLNDGFGIYEYEYSDSSGAFDSQIWSQSGTTDTLLYTYVNVGGVLPEGVLGGQYLYEVSVSAADGTASTQLYGTDGTAAGSQLLYTIPNYLGDDSFASANGFAFFQYEKSASGGQSAVVFSSNGTVAGTNPLVSLNGATNVSYNVGNYVSDGAGIAFEVLESQTIASTVTYTTLIYESDGTAAGTTLMWTLANTNGATFPQPLLTPAASATTAVGKNTVISSLGVLYYSTTSGAVVTVKITAVDGTVNTSANQGTVAGANSASLTLTGSLAQINADLAALTFAGTTVGNGSISVTASSNGTTSATSVSAVQVAPAVPGVAITSTGGLTNQTAQTISGTIDVYDAGLTVSIYDSGTLLGSVKPAANGNWTSTVTLPSTQGGQSLIAQATNAYGTVGSSQTVVYTLDTIAPALAITTAGGIVNQQAQSLSGTIDAADAGLVISIYDGTTLLGTTTANAGGTWTKAVTLSSAQGAHTLTTQATDAAGNTGTSAADVFTLQTLPPALAISGVGTGTSAPAANGTSGQTLSGTIDMADAGLAITIYDGATVLANASANASGVWTANIAALAQGVHTLTAQATNSFGKGTSNTETVLVSASTAVSGGNKAVVFLGTSNSVTLSATAGAWDTVNAGSGTVTLSGAQAAISGGGVAINFASGTSGNVVGLYATGGTWDAVSGTGGTVYLTGSQSAVTGGGNVISFAGGTGNVVGLHNTGGTWDSIWAPGAETIYLTSAQAAITGGGNTISFAGGTGNVVGLYNTGGNWDSIYAPGSETIYLTSAQSAINGGGNTISFAGGTGNVVGLYNTGGTWDSIYAPGSETIYLTSAQAAITGGGNAISFAGGTGNVVGLYNTGGTADTIWAPGSDTIYFTSAQAIVTGGGDSISFAGGTGNAATLVNTGVAGDSVYASNGTITLVTAQAAITGSTDTVNFAGTSAATLNGGSELLTFAHGIGGIDVINGYTTTDTLQFSTSDFANYAYLMNSGDVSQVGADTLIKLDANDSVRLTNFSASSLTSAQFHFV
ncbi:beta strand repeat-containing protein [Novosphingobium sp.]|uniref:beta strand repeat-containing protein n=1 Tax=Novosphingobium sp. TaxID=1874826 RepID=UPI003D0B94DF